jgi:putative phage-type endonuclease
MSIPAVALAPESRPTLQLVPPSAPTGGLTPEQLAFRLNGVGASEVAAVLGLDPYRTAYDVWVSKTAPHLREDEPSVAARRGQLLEPLAADLYAAENPGVVLTMGGSLSHPVHSCIMATPDRYVSQGDAKWLLEIKTKTWRSAKGFGVTGTDEIPDNVQLQAQQQMLVTGLSRCDIGVLVDDEFRVYSVAANADIQAIILERVPAWWQRHIVEGVRPDVDGSDTAAAFLRATIKQATRELRAGGETEGAIMERLAKANADLKAAEAEKALCTQQLMELTGEDGGIETSAGKFTWLDQNSAAKTDWKAIAAAANASPELIAQHTIKAGTIRVARFKPSK